MPLSSFDRTRLRQSPVFATLAGEAFDKIVPAARVLATGRETLVFAAGEAGDTLHILLEGRVALVGCMADRRSSILALLTPEEGLLDPAALTAMPHLVAARTTEPSRIACLPADLACHALESEPGFGRGAVAALAQHWRLLLRRLADQKLRSAPQRLASYLVENADGAALGQKASQGRGLGHDNRAPVHAPVHFVLAEDRRSLASHLGMTPENLSRVISQLRHHGVEFDGRSVTISDLDALRHFGCATTEL